MGKMPILSKGQGQCHVTKGHDNQESHLSSVTQVFRAILAIEVNGFGTLSEVQVKVRSQNVKFSNQQISSTKVCTSIWTSFASGIQFRHLCLRAIPRSLTNRI